MKKSFDSHRGNNIELVGDNWIYSDTKELVSETHNERPCGKCNEIRTPEGHDPCLGTLPNVMNACCGHGNNNQSYIQYENGQILRGDIALAEINKLKL